MREGTVSEQPVQGVEGSIWSATVDDGRFLLVVMPVEGHSHVGDLRVSVAQTDEELLAERVSVAFGAIFGPDADDVYEWQRRALDAIDDWLRARGEPIPDDGGQS